MAAGAQGEGEHREHFWVVLDYEHSIVHSRHPTFTVKSKGVAGGIRIVPVLVPARDRDGPDPHSSVPDHLRQSYQAADWERLPSCRLRSLSKEARYCATARAQVLKQSGREAPHRAAHRRDARAPIVFVSPASPDRMPCRWPAITETAPREREGTHPSDGSPAPVAQARRNPQPSARTRPKRSQVYRDAPRVKCRCLNGAKRNDPRPERRGRFGGCEPIKTRGFPPVGYSDKERKAGRDESN